jgi:Xaa-Pro aminopeptidase
VTSSSEDLTELDPRDPAEYTRRLREARSRTKDAGLTALLISPGTDLFYLTGYAALPLERLTCLLIQPGHAPVVLVPALEHNAALASPLAHLEIEIIPWQETQDPYAIIAERVSSGVLGLENQMWAEKVLAFLTAIPGSQLSLAGPVIQPMRSVKSAAEIQALQRAGAAIDAVHHQVPGFLKVGRTEREVGADISAAISVEHAGVDFVIVASGPNGASPHHQLSDRVIQAGEPIVVDIGGTMSDGYCSDCTRVYCIGEPPAYFADAYGILEAAQRNAVRSVRPGITASELDSAARDVLRDAELGEQFIHRTGHGIGLDTHEEPYIVQGNDQPIVAGNVFSIEPGVYFDGRYGARLEDIVVCASDGPIVLNNAPHGLTIV